ncbi:MAG: hypothetical protein EOP49_05935, partial [Sphingobacteriales bacterium]
MASGNFGVVRNNFITDIRNDITTGVAGTAYNLQNSVFGIRVTGNNHKIYHNSISLSGSLFGSGGSNGLTAAVGVSASVTGLDLRNNILSNTLSGGGAGTVHVCIYLPSMSSASTLTQNNNAYFSVAGAPYGIVQSDLTVGAGLYTAAGSNPGNAVSAANLRSLTSTLNTNNSNDNSSLASTMPAPFLSATNLHIPAGTMTPLESGGANLGVTADFDGQTRPGPSGSFNNGALNVDIGADEFDGILQDVMAPVIVAPVLNLTSITQSRTISNVEITDALSAINVLPGTKPRVYFKKATDADAYTGNTSAQNGWKYTESTSNSSPFTFTIDYSLLQSAVTAGDTVQYFIVAQDAASQPNIGISTGLFASTPVSVALTSVAFPMEAGVSSYAVVPSLGGTVNVGTGQTYTSLTGSNGLFDALNKGALTSELTVKITSNLSEDGSVGLNELAYDGTTTGYAVTIQPSAAVERLISGDVSQAMIRLNGADLIKIDGRFNNAGRYLRFRNTNTSNPTLLLQSDATYDTIRNCYLEGSNTAGTTLGVVLIGAGATTGNDYNAFTGNIIRDRSDAAGQPSILINSSGTAAATSSDIAISNNELFNATGIAINIASAGAGDKWLISGNSIYYNNATPSAVAQTGITLLGGSNHEISGNYIGGTAALCGGTAWVNSGAITLIGIQIGTATTFATSVQGNTVQNISLTGTAGVNFNGILVSGGQVNLGTITPNLIGHNTTAGSISNSGSSATSVSVGLNHTGANTVVFANNVVAHIVSTGTTNSVGVRGISNTGAGAFTAFNNTVHSLTSSASTSTYTTSAPVGIYAASSSPSQIISQNLIYNLTNLNGTANASVIGISVNASTGSGTLSRNRVYGLSSASSGIPIIAGIAMVAGNGWVVSNNQVSITNGSNTNAALISGIREAAAATATNYYYHNTVYIGGSAASGATGSYAFTRTTTSIVNLRNNLLYNARTGGTGGHNAIANQATTPATNWTSTTSDFNIFISASLG